MTNERLELVTDFESLKAGDEIAILACDCGQIFCRSQLTIFHPGAGMLGPGWFSSPQCRLPNSNPFNIALLVGEAAVRSGCLFRVVKPHAEEPSEVSSRKKSSTRKS